MRAGLASMHSHPLLDRPIWNALVTRQEPCAVIARLARRYRPEAAPFAAVENLTSEAEADLCSIVQPGESVGLLAETPEFSSQWEVQKRVQICQMVCENPLPQTGQEPPMRRLTEEDIPAMLQLTELVYPAYFRPGTARLGAYFGIFAGDQLCAMAGERMGMTGYQEISAVCTHPDFLGRGYAGSLVCHLTRLIAERGDVPFLHADEDNLRAISLYERIGFEHRRLIPFCVVKRA
ncbi:MAG: GNAT family N-acetyltransferase [Armatimonadota bacterium]